MIYLYNSEGEWIAVRKDNYLFNKSGKWIGYFPKSGNDALDLDNNYLATVYNGDRLLVNRYKHGTIMPDVVSRPFGLGFISAPMGIKTRVSIMGTSDVSERKLKL